MRVGRPGRAAVVGRGEEGWVGRSAGRGHRLQPLRSAFPALRVEVDPGEGSPGRIPPGGGWTGAAGPQRRVRTPVKSSSRERAWSASTSRRMSIGDLGPHRPLARPGAARTSGRSMRSGLAAAADAARRRSRPRPRGRAPPPGRPARTRATRTHELASDGQGLDGHAPGARRGSRRPGPSRWMLDASRSRPGACRRAATRPARGADCSAGRR